MSKAYQLAKEICRTLFDAGYTAYFAGGWVRDFILGQESDDIDIATNAPPHIIQKTFPKTVPVGIAFGVIVIVTEGMNFEVTTFRKDHSYLDGRHPEGVDFSTAEKDAWRRDFTINGMFYDPLNDTIYDYVEGQKDLERKMIKAIGNPFERFTEDRLRMVRAIRFSARLGFQIEQQTALAIRAFAPTLLPAVSMERIWQELCKMAAFPSVSLAFHQMHAFGLLEVILPRLALIPKREIEERIAGFKNFPTQTPPILYIMEFFSHSHLGERMEICTHLKTTVKDRKLVEFFEKSSRLFSQSVIEFYEWAHFYAHPLSSLFIEIKDPSYLTVHIERQQLLESHIFRIVNQKPLVRASDLQNHGIQPGKEMGRLLKESERIAINHNLNEADAVLQRLFQKG